MNSVPENSEPKNELWLVCPMCKQPNPAGTKHCLHCWGPALYSVEPIPYQEATEVLKRWQARLKRLNRIKIVAVSIVAPLMLASAVFLGLYSFTDKVFPPPADISSSPLPGEWTMFRRDLDHSGSTRPGSTSPEGTLKWTFSTGAPIHSSPTVVDGIVYVGSQDCKLYAVDAETGEKLWEYEAGSWVESSPAVVKGVVYFGSNDGILYALDASTGDKLWYFEAKYGVHSSPAVADGIVYFGANDSRVYALDAVTGTRLWDFETDRDIYSSPAVANGIVYVGSVDSYLYCFHAETGRLRLKFNTYQWIISSPAVSDGVVYFNSGGYLYAVDGNARNWPGEHALAGFWAQFYALRLAPPPPPISGFLWRLKLGSSINPSDSSPAIANGTIYTSIANNLCRIDPEKIDLKRVAELRAVPAILDYIQSLPGCWVFSAESMISSSPALGDNTVYVGSEDGHVYALDATTGEQIWDFPAGDKVTSSPALAGGTIYIGSHDGNLYAIE